MLRTRLRGFPARPRCPRVSCWTRRRTSSSACPASLTTWNASSTGVASDSSSRSALAYPRNGSRVATFTPSRKAAVRSVSQAANTVADRPGTRSSNRAWTVPSPSRVRSTIPVSIVGPLIADLCAVWCHTLGVPPARSAARGGIIDPERDHTTQTGLIVSQRLEQRADRAPQRLPRRPQLPGQARDRGVLAAQLADRPGHRPARQRPARADQVRALLDEHTDRAPGVRAPPGPLPPPDRHRDHPGHVAQHSQPPPTPHSDDPAPWAAHQLRRRRDRHGHARRTTLDVLDMDTVHAEQDITARAGIDGGCAGAPRSVGQRRGPRSDQDAWSLPILGDLDPSHPQPAHRRAATPTASPKSPETADRPTVRAG